jgi:Fic-DOC domain mobile mystery protein B
LRPDPPISGQTPLDDLSGLKIKSIRTQAALNAAEAENIRKAALKYLASQPARRTAPFTTAWALRLHKEMFGQVWTWAGAIRTRELNLGSPPAHIATDLHNLFEDLHAWQTTGMSLDEQAVRLHHQAVRIHPFLNGNGRWARMLANVLLKLHGAAPIEWPEAIIGTASAIRGQYIAAIKAADGHDYAPLIVLHQRYASQP